MEGKIKAALCGPVGRQKNAGRSVPNRNVHFRIAMCVFWKSPQHQRFPHIARKGHPTSRMIAQRRV
jgi:hypothetical protein